MSLRAEILCDRCGTSTPAVFVLDMHNPPATGQWAAPSTWARIALEGGNYSALNAVHDVCPVCWEKIKAALAFR